jgi:hypothetical protein
MKMESQIRVKSGNLGAGGVIQVVEHLPSKCEALSSNPSTKKKRKERKKDPGASDSCL